MTFNRRRQNRRDATTAPDDAYYCLKRLIDRRGMYLCFFGVNKLEQLLYYLYYVYCSLYQRRIISVTYLGRLGLPV